MLKTKKIRINKSLSFGSVFIFSLLSTILVFCGSAEAVANAQNTYTNIYMPASNLTNISHDLTINNVADLGTTPYFWSHQFGFSGPGVPSEGGAYIGLQGINKAVFSIFDYASTESSSDCTVSQNGFDGYSGESGTSCISSYAVTQGHTYRLQVTNEGQDSQGINWLGSVEDLTSGITTNIATINVAANWGNLSSGSSAWTEWFGSAPSSCSALPYSNVTFSNFTANNGQYSAPSSHSDSLQTGTGCSGYSQIIDNSYNSFNQIMGIDPPVTNTIVPYSPPSTPIPAKATPQTSGKVPSTKTEQLTPAPSPATPTAPNKQIKTTITVKITDSKGSVVPNVKVTINGIREATNGNGIAIFTDVGSGSYTAIIQPPNANTQEAKLYVAPNKTSQLLNFRLAASRASFLSIYTYVIVIVLVVGVILLAWIKHNVLRVYIETKLEIYHRRKLS